MPKDNSGAKRMEESEMAVVKKKMFRGLQGGPSSKTKGPLEEMFSHCSFLFHWFLKSSLVFGMTVYLPGPPSKPRSFCLKPCPQSPVTCVYRSVEMTRSR